MLLDDLAALDPAQRREVAKGLRKDAGTFAEVPDGRHTHTCAANGSRRHRRGRVWCAARWCMGAVAQRCCIASVHGGGPQPGTVGRPPGGPRVRRPRPRPLRTRAGAVVPHHTGRSGDRRHRRGRDRDSGIRRASGVPSVAIPEQRYRRAVNRHHDADDNPGRHDADDNPGSRDDGQRKSRPTASGGDRHRSVDEPGPGRVAAERPASAQ